MRRWLFSYYPHSPLTLNLHNARKVLGFLLLYMLNFLFTNKILPLYVCIFNKRLLSLQCDLKERTFMKKRRKSRQLKENEDDMLFYLENWKKFPDHFQKIAQKEIDELEKKIKNN